MASREVIVKLNIEDLPAVKALIADAIAQRDAAVARAETAEQAVARVREAFQRWSGGPDDEFEQAMRRALEVAP